MKLKSNEVAQLTDEARDIYRKIRKRIREKLMAASYIVAAFATSIWVNILHVGTENRYQAYFFAALPPLIALGGWEFVSRVSLVHTKGFVRYLRPAAVGLIASGAAWLSYWHQRDAILLYVPEEPLYRQSALIIPILIDGLMVVASVTSFELKAAIEHLTTEFKQLRKAEALEAQETPPPPRPSRTKTKTEQVQELLRTAPELSPRALAEKAGTTRQVVYNMRSAAKKGKKEVQAA